MESKIDQYFYLFGMFMHGFAEIETLVKLTCAQIMKLPNYATLALMADMPLNKASTLLEDACKSNQDINHALLKRCLVQLDTIAKVRNRLVHHGVELGAEQMNVSNVINTAYGDKKIYFSISNTDLGNINADISKIKTGLMAQGLRAMRNSPNLYCSDPDGIIALDESAALAPWRYIPPAQRKGGHHPKKMTKTQP